jgi:glycosyltransferase involved in cell wall biosynthesis
MHDFGVVKKRHGQVWILDLHFWDLEEDETSRLADFDVICTRSEIHQKHIEESTRHSIPVAHVYNDICPELFKPLLNVRRENNSIAYAGAIVPHKGVEKVIQAFVVLKQSIPELSLNIYGSATMWNHGNEYEDYLRTLAAGLVNFHGAISYQEMPKVFSENSLLVLPSRVESFSLVSIEAQACGCIPVIHRSGGVEATMIDGETGFLYTPNTYERLSECLLKALPRANHMREAARKFVTTKFDNKLHAKKYTELLLQTDFTTSSVKDPTYQPGKTHSQLLQDMMDN